VTGPQIGPSPADKKEVAVAATLTEPEVIESRCNVCGAEMAIRATERTERCPFCDATAVVMRPDAPERPQPTFALGFIVEREDAARKAMDWIRRQKMAPSGLKTGVAERITGIYLPAYLYSATAQSQYQASIGETYTKTRLERNDEGRMSIRTREETEFWDLKGRHLTPVADILVTASRSLANEEVEAIEPFELGHLRRYTPALIAGWTSEEPTLTPHECGQLARTEAFEGINQALRQFMPGDRVSSLEHETQFVDESLELALVPVWVCAVRYHPQKPPLRILVNGQTGKVGGKIPFSWARLGLRVTVGLIIAGLVIELALLVGGLL
jgi:hypothetical protein